MYNLFDLYILCSSSAMYTSFYTCVLLINGIRTGVSVLGVGDCSSLPAKDHGFCSHLTL